MTGELIVIESATKKDSSITATSSRMDRLGEAGKTEIFVTFKHQVCIAIEFPMAERRN